MFSPKKIALGTSAAALALGLSLGATGMASATTTPTPAPTSSATAEAAAGSEATTIKRGHGLRGGMDAAKLAAKLGVDEAAVTGALQAARDAARADTGEKPDRDALKSAIAASLARTLGLEEAAVQTAITELEAEHKAERSAAVQDRLNAAVTDGSLTQAEADGAAKAHKLGILGGGRG